MLNLTKYSALRQLADRDDRHNRTLLSLKTDEKTTLEVYPKSIHYKNDVLFWIARSNGEKYLYVATPTKTGDLDSFQGDLLSSDSYHLKRCPQNSKNREVLQRIFSFTNPSVIGNRNSIGFADGLGLAGPGQLRSLKETGFIPVLAQYSEQERIHASRTPVTAMDGAVWAVFQEGWHGDWGAYANHVETLKEIEVMALEGFTTFCIDPITHVDCEAEELDLRELTSRFKSLPWDTLKTTPENLRQRFARKMELSQGVVVSPCWEEVMRTAVKFGRALSFLVDVQAHLEKRLSDRPFEIEIALDSTPKATKPFEHLFVAEELIRLGVQFVGVAPGYVGEFEECVDYSGDKAIFGKNFEEHLAVMEAAGSYKLSLRSGCDKISLISIIKKSNIKSIHINASGSSYLEAIRTTAIVDPDLFRRIFEFSRNVYEEERKGYKVSAEISRLPDLSELTDAQLPFILNNGNERQVILVASARIMNDQESSSGNSFGKEVMKRLAQHDLLYQILVQKECQRHLEIFYN